MAGVKQFVSDLLTDLRRSRRFQIAVIIWIPLVVTTIVAIAGYGAVLQDALATNYAKVEFNVESTVATPLIYMKRDDLLPYFQTVTCRNSNGAALTNLNTKPCNYFDTGSITDPKVCTVIPSVNIPAPSAWTIESVGYTCLITFVQNNYVDTTFRVTMVGADNIPDDRVFIQPTLFQSVELDQEFSATSESANIDISWGGDVDVYNAIAINMSNPMSLGHMQLYFRIGNFGGMLYTGYSAYTNYQFLSAWGGIMFTFYFFFWIVYGIVKLFTAPDSKLLDPTGSAPYTPLTG